MNRKDINTKLQNVYKSLRETRDFLADEFDTKDANVKQALKDFERGWDLISESIGFFTTHLSDQGFNKIHVKDSSGSKVSKKGKEVFTIMVISDTIEVNQEMFKEQWETYYSLDEACDAAELLAEDIALNMPEFDDQTVVTVFGGQYEDSKGNVWGEPMDIYSVKISEYRK